MSDVREVDPRVFEVTRELRRLRSAKEPFTATKLAAYPFLVALTGETDIPDAAAWLRDYADMAARGNKFVRCAADTTFGEGADVLARLTEAAAVWGVDQRTARAWSDQGLPLLAHALLRASELAAVAGISENTIAVEAHGEGVRLRISTVYDVVLGHFSPYVGYHDDLMAAEGDHEEFAIEAEAQGAVEIEPGGEDGREYRRVAYGVLLPHPRSHGWRKVSILFRERSLPHVKIASIVRPDDYLVTVDVYRHFVGLEFIEGDPAEVLEAKLRV